MRELTIPKVEDAARFFPDPVLVESPITRTLDDGFGEFYHPKHDTWERIHPICLDIIRGLEQGLAFKDLVRGLPLYPAYNIDRPNAMKVARKYCWKLHTLGYVRMDLEEAPAVFHGRYARIKELGRGGLGIAHLCRDEKEGGREVVVKHPWGVKSDIKSGQRAVAYEIEIMRSLDHPAIPRFYDEFQVRGLLHLVREYFDGARLPSAAARNRTDRAWRLGITRQIADVLHLIHEAGYLFYDAAPDNFFLRPDGTVVVSDVGSARPHEGGKQKVRGPRGSPGYIAPEMRSDENIHDRWASYRSDVYSLGGIYLYLTTGRKTSRSGGFEKTTALMDEMGIQPEDRAIIAHMMADDPEARPADMRAVREILR